MKMLVRPADQKQLPTPALRRYSITRSCQPHITHSLITDLDLESPLESAGEESSERSDDGRKDGHEESVKQERVQRHCLLHLQLQRKIKSLPSRNDVTQLLKCLNVNGTQQRAKSKRHTLSESCDNLLRPFEISKIRFLQEFQAKLLLFLRKLGC